jgi:hypothetical protein
MTDAAVAADPGPAPDVAPSAPINEAPANLTSPLGSQIPPDAVAKPAEPKAPPSLDDSIDRAIAKSAEKQAAPKDAKADVKAQPVAKEPGKAEQPRENGKFAPKDGAKAPAADSAVAVDDAKPAEAVKPSHTADDAPARFTETAKAKWAAADPEIRGETLRMQKELTEGYQKHKAAAERDGALAEFHEMAQKSGTDVKTALSKYTALEGLLRQDPIKGLNEVCNNMGLSLRDVAAHVLGQTPDQNASQQDATIRELRQQNSSLEERLNKLEGGFNQQREQSTLTEINKFASENPRFDELADDIAFFMQSGRAKDLPEAYQLAERLNPAPAKAADPAASSAAIDPPVHPDKGQKSINGAPSAGFTSRAAARKGPAPSIDEALDHAYVVAQGRR